MTEFNYLEKVDSTSPGESGFAIDSARATMLYQVDSPSPSDLQQMIIEVIGNTDVAVGDGSLSRTPPLAHPLYPWMYANSVKFRGMGSSTKMNSEPELEVPPFDSFQLYNQYQLTVDFTPRPYTLLQDPSITVAQSSWVNDQDEIQDFNYADEWIRYTDFQIKPIANFVTAQQGTLSFRSTNTGIGGVDGRILTNPINMYLPDQLVKFTWYYVPFRYVESPNSYFPRWIGRINQSYWNGFPPGSLLYLNYDPVRFTPPVQQTSEFSPGVIAADKLCNIEFTFLYTNRTADDLPDLVDFISGNFIPAGHNLLPLYVDRKFHFALSNPVDTTKINPTPAWLSFPIEELFYDPDADNGIPLP